VRILYRNRDAWFEPVEQSAGLETQGGKLWDYAAAVQKFKHIEREADDLIEPASKLIKNYIR
jgi:hypothetical protein